LPGGRARSRRKLGIIDEPLHRSRKTGNHRIAICRRNQKSSVGIKIIRRGYDERLPESKEYGWIRRSDRRRLV
jgi:hypothetical protein